MKLKMYAVYDTKVEAFLRPFFMRTRGEALRAWQELANDEQTQFCKHPTDFALMELGEYDDSQGTVDNYKAPTSLGLASEMKRETLEHIGDVVKKLPQGAPEAADLRN